MKENSEYISGHTLSDGHAFTKHLPNIIKSDLDSHKHLLQKIQN